MTNDEQAAIKAQRAAEEREQLMRKFPAEADHINAYTDDLVLALAKQVHLADNSHFDASVMAGELKRLQAENAALREVVRQLAESFTDTIDSYVALHEGEWSDSERTEESFSDERALVARARALLTHLS